jgi:hypothetical protein
MREAIERNIALQKNVIGKTPANDRASDQATLVLITKMLKVLPGHRLDETGAEATGDAYMIALDDLPSWTVDEALRQWYRGEAGPDYDYRWRPAPAVLREIACRVLFEITYHIKQLQGLLKAEPLIEYSEDHCRMMRKRLSELFRQIAERDDPIDRVRREHRERAERELRANQARAIADLKNSEAVT